MHSIDLKTDPRRRCQGFTLVEMIVVIAIMSILMTAGAIGLGGMGGKGVTSGVATAESLFDEARGMAIGKNIRTCVLIAKNLTNNSADNLKRIVIAYENTDVSTGLAKDPSSSTPDWVISSRGSVLPDQTYFSQVFSGKDHQSAGGDIPFVLKDKIKSAPSASSSAAPVAVKAAYEGDYYIYEFNSQGICSTPGASFVIGSGSRGINASATEKPKVTSAGKRDFGGFVVWRNGRTSMFRNPTQISSSIQSLSTGAPF
jgi:prepilin-type N-terminal cleavage/methylation domain-containing protein